jgi:hypothetical protein
MTKTTTSKALYPKLIGLFLKHEGHNMFTEIIYSADNKMKIFE